MSKVEYRKIVDLVPFAINPRAINPAAFKRLRKKVKENPEYFEARPCLLSNRTGELVIIAGNRRSEAAAANGQKEVPTILMEGLTEEKERELNLLDNYHEGTWDVNALVKNFTPEEYKQIALEIPGLSFVPNLEPEQSIEKISAKDVAKSAEELAKRFKNKPQEMLEVACPHCGEEFNIRRSDAK